MDDNSEENSSHSTEISSDSIFNQVPKNDEKGIASEDKHSADPFKVPTSGIILKKNIDGGSSSNKDDNKDNLKCKISSKDVHKEDEKPSSGSSKTSSGIKFGYKIPHWSKVPGPNDSKFELSEIKNGVVVKKFQLVKPFYIFGRKDVNDITMLNPSVSRHHLVLQYGDPSGNNCFSWHLYDMNSGNGTFLNKHKVSPGIYIKVEDGFMFKLGCSDRFFLLDEISSKKHESEETRVPKQIYSSDDESESDEEDFHNKNLVNSLKQWFQNEGQEPHFNVEKFDRIYVCKIRLPLKEIYGDESEDFEGEGEGRTKDEAIYDAVGKCWEHLETIGITPAGTKRTRNWKENNYYDSDEDPFFDRTGDLEKKRLKRMKSDKTDKKSQPKTIAENRISLISERENLVKYIKYLEEEIKKEKVKSDSGDEEKEELEDHVMIYRKTCREDLIKKQEELSNIDLKLKVLEESTKQASLSS